MADTSVAARPRVAITLAAIAGWVDAVGFLVLFGLFTAHLSGNTARLGVELGQGNVGLALYLRGADRRVLRRRRRWHGLHRAPRTRVETPRSSPRHGADAARRVPGPRHGGYATPVTSWSAPARTTRSRRSPSPRWACRPRRCGTWPASRCTPRSSPGW